MTSTCTAVADRKAHGFLAAATGAAIATLIPVAGHQFGAIDHRPDPPGSFFASDRITELKSTHPRGIPDAPPGIGSYGVTLALAVMAPTSPRARRPLAFKLPLDGALAGFNVVRQIASFGKLCFWCTATALSTAVMWFAGRQVVAQENGKAESCR